MRRFRVPGPTIKNLERRNGRTLGALPARLPRVPLSSQARLLHLHSVHHRRRFSLKEMKNTTQLTREALNGSTDTLNKTLAKMQEQIDAARTANANFIDSERPWMGGTISIQEFASGGHPTSYIVFNNTGNAPPKFSKQTSRVVFTPNSLKTPKTNIAREVFMEPPLSLPTDKRSPRAGHLLAIHRSLLTTLSPPPFCLDSTPKMKFSLFLENQIF